MNCWWRRCTRLWRSGVPKAAVVAGRAPRMTTRKNVRRGALRPQQKADLRSLRLAFIATLPHGKETQVCLGDDADRCVDQGAAFGLSMETALIPARRV